MPQGSEILHFGMDPAGQLCVWAMVESTGVGYDRHLQIVGTGAEVPGGPVKYIGTSTQGPFVWHLFEINPYRPATVLA
jgi:hypothetical protein